MVLIGIVVQNVLALFAILMMAFAPVPNRRVFVLLSAGSASLLVGLILAGIWVYPPLYGASIYVLVFGLVISLRIRSLSYAGRARPIFLSIVSVTMLGLGLVFIGFGTLGRVPPTEPFVELAPPHPRDERFCVLSGGNTLLLNAHFLEGPNTGASFERHSVDFIKLNRFRFRTKTPYSLNPKPVDPAGYAIFDEPVFAPCSGDVVSVENDKPDNLAGFEYRSHEGSNLVELSCKNAYILLAHFRRNSVRVSKGQSVEAGDLLGFVGNSGNTEEPHLHIHAQSTSFQATEMAPAQAIPIRFDGRYLSRGDCL